MHMHANTQTHSHIHTCKHAHASIHTHTHTHTHTHGFSHRQWWQRAVYHRERAYNSFNPALRCDSPLSSQMSEKSTTPGREGGWRKGRSRVEWRIKGEWVSESGNAEKRSGMHTRQITHIYTNTHTYVWEQRMEKQCEEATRDLNWSLGLCNSTDQAERSDWLMLARLPFLNWLTGWHYI